MNIKLLGKIVILTAIIFAIIMPNDLYSAKKSYKSKKAKTHKTKAKNKAKIIESISKLKQYYPEYYSYISKDTSFIYNFSRPAEVSNNSIFSSVGLRYDLIATINSWLGVPYRSSGSGRGGVDCSNFVSCITEEAMGIAIPAGSATQATMFKHIYSIDSLQFGDLIFFTGRNKKSKRIGHVGYYIGNGLFAHSSTGRGVIYTHITEGYYNERYRYGGRFDNKSWTVNPERKSNRIYLTEIPE